MNKIITIICLIPFITFSQSYAPPAGQQGSSAIHKDSQSFVSWASGITMERGFVNIEDTTYEVNGSNRVTFGDPQYVLGPSSGNPADAVSLGDSGVAILTFDQPIINGPGYDFAVFENSFSDDYLEFAHVEVSSNGVDFIRFPSHSEVQSQVQIHGFGLTDTRRIHNLAGKYRVGYGTPFDLEDLIDSSLVDVNNITHVKIIDVVGSLGHSGTFDSFGNKINEPFSTPYESGGFDLEAVGVINKFIGLNESSKNKLTFNVYPNPNDGNFQISFPKPQDFELTLLSTSGQIQFKNTYFNKNVVNDTPKLSEGIYFLIIELNQKTIRRKIIVKN